MAVAVKGGDRATARIKHICNRAFPTLFVRIVHKWPCTIWRMSNTEAVIFMDWNAVTGTRLDGLRTIAAALTARWIGGST